MANLSSDTDSSSSATPLTNATSSTDTTLVKTPNSPSMVPVATSKPSTKNDASWRDKLISNKVPSEPGKETWRDASLSEEKRWKEWQKAKDKEQHDGSATGTFTGFYKGKGKSGYWLATLWPF